MLLPRELTERYQEPINVKYMSDDVQNMHRHFHEYFNKLTSHRSCSLAKIAALLQSITSLNGNAHPFESKTGIHPACKASRNLKVPSRRPLGIRQNEEFFKSSL